MSASDWTTVDFVEILHETDKAFLVKIKRKSGKTEDIWIPMSVICDYEDYSAGDRNGSISINNWWAAKENIQ